MIKDSVAYLLNMKDDELKVANKLCNMIGRFPEQAMHLLYLFLRRKEISFDEIRKRKIPYHQQILAITYRFLKLPVIKMKVQALNTLGDLILATSAREPQPGEKEDSGKPYFFLSPVDRKYAHP